MTLDEARQAFPHLGFCVYAMEPGKPLTLEIHAPDGTIFTFYGATEAEALARAFPETATAAEPELGLFD